MLKKLLLILCLPLLSYGQSLQSAKFQRVTADTVIVNYVITADSGKFGGSSNYVTISDSLGVTLEGDATVWDDIMMPVTSGRLGALSKPDFNYDSVTVQFPFNDSTEILYFIAQLPHRYKDGTNIYPHVHWKQTEPTGDASSDTVEFAIQYKWFNIGAAPPSSWSWELIGTPEISYTSGMLHQLTATASGIDGTGKTKSSVLLIKLKRREAKGPLADVEVYQMDIHFEVSRLGTSSIYN